MKTKAQDAEVGVIVGRFQVPELHDAHKELISKVLNDHPRVLIFLGLSPCKCTYNNPLDYECRRAMIQEAFPDVDVYYINDIPSDNKWSSELDRQIESVIGANQSVVLYGGRDSFIPYYKGKFPVIELVPDRIISGKEMRKKVGIRSKRSKEFREGAIWAVENQWRSVLPTVDIAIMRNNNSEVLLARKSTEDALRFIGGFSTTDCATYEADAKREVMEESGVEVNEVKYVGSTLIDDWRYQNEQNKIKTLFFTAQYVFGAARASDDIAEVQWCKLDKLKPEDIMPEHRPLVAMLIAWRAERE